MQSHIHDDSVGTIFCGLQSAADERAPFFAFVAVRTSELSRTTRAINNNDDTFHDAHPLTNQPTFLLNAATSATLGGECWGC